LAAKHQQEVFQEKKIKKKREKKTTSFEDVNLLLV
jgi:hypothetical protein